MRWEIGEKQWVSHVDNFVFVTQHLTVFILLISSLFCAWPNCENESTSHFAVRAVTETPRRSQIENEMQLSVDHTKSWRGISNFSKSHKNENTKNHVLFALISSRVQLMHLCLSQTKLAFHFLCRFFFGCSKLLGGCRRQWREEKQAKHKNSDERIKQKLKWNEKESIASTNKCVKQIICLHFVWIICVAFDEWRLLRVRKRLFSAFSILTVISLAFFFCCFVSSSPLRQHSSISKCDIDKRRMWDAMRIISCFYSSIVLRFYILLFRVAIRPVVNVCQFYCLCLCFVQFFLSLFSLAHKLMILWPRVCAAIQWQNAREQKNV